MKALASSIRTVLFIVRKETRQVLRDRIMLLQIFLPPVIQLLVLAQAMTFEVKRVDLALLDLDRSPASERLIERFTATDRFRLEVYTTSQQHADQALLTRDANAILRIPDGFGREFHRGRAPEVQLILNAEDGAAAGVIQSYASQILMDFSRENAFRMQQASMSVARGPSLQIQTRTLYNPEREYLGFMAIGLLAALVTLIGVLLTSQNIAREKEIGTLEQLNVTPITRSEFIAGKLVPFWVLGLIELTIGLLIIRLVFGIPYEGSVALVYLGAAIYLFAALGLGLLISTVAQTQQQAQFITFFVVVTLFFLGGIFTPVQSMPEWAQTAAAFNPIKHFVVILRSVLMKGAALHDVLGALGAMGAFAVFALGLAIVRYRKTAA